MEDLYQVATLNISKRKITSIEEKFFLANLKNLGKIFETFILLIYDISNIRKIIFLILWVQKINY